jgi:esterase
MAVKLAFEQSGSGDAVILLHGLFGSRRNLNSIARHLSSDHAVCTPDLRNHGNSPHHDTMDYRSMAADIYALMDDCNLNRAVLIGHSMGGKIAMVNALLNPEMVTALVVLDIAPARYNFEHTHILDSLASLDPDTISSRQEADRLLGKEYANPMFRQFLLQNMVRRDGRYAWRLNLQAIRTNIDHITGFPDDFEGGYSGPTLFLGGEHSSYIKEQHRDEINRLFPDNEIRKIRDAGHWLHAEQGKAVNREISGFLEKLNY